MIKTLNSFIVDDGTKQFKIALIRYTTDSRLIRHLYLVGKYPIPFFTKFFAKRFFTKLKEGYESCWLQYGVYDDIR